MANLKGALKIDSFKGFFLTIAEVLEMPAEILEPVELRIYL